MKVGRIELVMSSKLRSTQLLTAAAAALLAIGLGSGIAPADTVNIIVNAQVGGSLVHPGSGNGDSLSISTGGFPLEGPGWTSINVTTNAGVAGATDATMTADLSGLVAGNGSFSRTIDWIIIGNGFSWQPNAQNVFTLTGTYSESSPTSGDSVAVQAGGNERTGIQSSGGYIDYAKVSTGSVDTFSTSSGTFPTETSYNTTLSPQANGYYALVIEGTTTFASSASAGKLDLTATLANVPEPSAGWLLAGCAALALPWRRWRKRYNV